MTDKAKPPQPMAFKNLAELKRYIKIGTEFKATSHKYHPDIVGLTRVVTKVQTNGFYSKSRMSRTIGSPTAMEAKAFSLRSARPADISLTALRLRCWTSAVKTALFTNWNFTEKTRR